MKINNRCVYRKKERICMKLKQICGLRKETRGLRKVAFIGKYL